MFNIDEIIGDIVFVSFKDKVFLKDIGIMTKNGHFKIVGKDHLGLWLQHPRLIIVTKTDSTGKPLAMNERIEKEIDGVFLVFYHNIDTIMHYPEREGFDFPSEFDKKYGFNFKE